MDALAAATERLYAAFHGVPRPREIDACPCGCSRGKRLDRLLAVPREALSAYDLGPYGHSALLTVGSPADYLYFLPRILEVSLIDAGEAPSPEATARAIEDAGLARWPAARRVALEDFLNAAVAWLVERGELWQLDGWVYAIARLGFDVHPALAVMAKSRPAVLSYFESNAENLREGRLRNPFWELPHPGHDAIVAWFRSDTVRRIIADEYGSVW